jgi:hypothetical protein
VKLVALVAVPPGVVIAILPLVAPIGTVAEIRALLTKLKVAAVPLKVTLVAPAKPLPSMVTTVLTGPEGGVKLVTAGVGITVKSVELEPVPTGLVTAILPLAARVGTMAVIRVLLSTLNVEEVPLKVTLLASAKLVPVIVTVAPSGPEVGVKLVTVGAVGDVVTPSVTALAPMPAFTMPPALAAWPRTAWAKATVGTGARSLQRCVNEPLLPMASEAWTPLGNAKASVSTINV